ncbi:MAG TPA: hypothetical protein VGM95_02125 [Lactobacillaceae bacterium]|jgi:hypothetical protein
MTWVAGTIIKIEQEMPYFLVDTTGEEHFFTTLTPEGLTSLGALLNGFSDAGVKTDFDQWRLDEFWVYKDSTHQRTPLYTFEVSDTELTLPDNLVFKSGKLLHQLIEQVEMGSLIENETN